MRYFSLLLLLCLTAFHVTAQETDGYVTDLNVGFTLTTGNSESTLFKFGAAAENIKEKQETLLSLSYDYGRTKETNDEGVETETTQIDRANAEAQSNWLYSEEFYAFLNITAENDELANITYRINAGPGLGYYFLRNDVSTLTTETSVVYVTEDVGNKTDDYAAFRLAQRAEYKFSESSRIWQRLEGVISFSDAENYFLNVEVGAESKLNDRIGLRVVLQDKYNNQPDTGIDNNDLTLFSGISIRL